MFVELHLVDGTTLVTGLEGEQAEENRNASEGLDKLLDLLRRLKVKAKRVGTWHTTLKDTERCLVDAALILRKLGPRIKRIIEQICLKLRQANRWATLERLKEAGLKAASTLASFFKDTKILENAEYLVYHGLRELFAQKLRPTTG